MGLGNRSMNIRFICQGSWLALDYFVFFLYNELELRDVMNQRFYINSKYYIEKVGVGKPLYVIGGGPGLDYSYLYKFLVPLSDTRELVFYNQYGLYKEECTSLDILCEQLHDILTFCNEKKDVFVHSFGSHLLFSVLEKYDDVNIDKIVVINPSPLKYDDYVKSSKVLLKRIPKEVMEKIHYFELKNSEEAGLMIMSLLLPYYLYDSGKKVDFSIYNHQMCDKINSEITKFDFSNFCQTLQNDILLIKGDYDFISVADTLELQIVSKKTIMYDHCGHFAFAEKQKSCLNEIRKFLDT